MTAAGSLPHWSAAEEIAHSVSHGVGIVLAIAGLVALVAMGAAHGDAWDVTSAAIYGTTLVLLYVASTLYHAIPLWRAKRVLRVLDHSAIYLLIAGTYTDRARPPAWPLGVDAVRHRLQELRHRTGTDPLDRALRDHGLVCGGRVRSAVA